MTAAVQAAPNPPCGQCWSMTTWLAARGPEEIAERIRVMLALVELGRAEVAPPAHVPSLPDYRPWPEVDPQDITPSLIANGRADGLVVDSALTIRCSACRREYRQSWVAERGYERWTITCDAAAIAGPPAS